METPTPANSGDTDRLLQRVAAGDRDGWGALGTQHRARLRALIALCRDRRLQGRNAAAVQVLGVGASATS